MNSRSKIVLTIILLAAILLPAWQSELLLAQGQVSEVVIPQGKVDYTNFPSVTIKAIVSDDTRSRVEGLTEADFTLREDGQTVPFVLSEEEMGIQVVFVLDASANTRQNGASGYTRLEEGKQVIYNFAENHMADFFDQIAVLAPKSSTEIQKVAPLPDDPDDFTPFTNTVSDGTYLYDIPQGVSNTPLNDLVSGALKMLESSASELHRAVVVISDGIDVISDREVADIVRTANSLNVPIYTIIFGPTSNWGGQAESNMKRLSLDSHGAHYQLSAQTRKPEAIDSIIEETMTSLYEKLDSQRDQYVLTYSSGIFSAGSHEISLDVGGKSTKTSMSINVRPPQVTILQPAAGITIDRITDDPGILVQDIEPRTQVVDFEVSWPDGFQREITHVDLLVDGVAVTDACIPPCNQIIWNLTSLGSGSHSIRVRVRDQQGQEAESVEVPLNITIVTPTPVPTATPTPYPTPTPMPAPLACEDQFTGMTRIVRCNPEIWSLAALIIALFALLLAVFVVRRRPQVISSVVNKVKEITEPFFLDRDRARSARETKAVLVILEGDDPSRKPIELVGDNIRIGRDEALAQVVLNDRSVSRLHARISEEGDRKGGARFMLYDEGSTSGTYVNYEPVGINGQWLQHDDIVNLGRVRMQFKLRDRLPAGKEGEAAIDATIPMQPIFPGKGQIEDSTDTVIAGAQGRIITPPSKIETPVDPFATEPYEPAEPLPAIDQTQPMIPGSAKGPATPPPDDFDAGDGVSTEPYVPMDFGDE
ncbi:MAG: FHA domain-containing protein [Anaerolineales bacterium]|nr:FHA domain-containing protein [Anaerolineales bacterium]